MAYGVNKNQQTGSYAAADNESAPAPTASNQGYYNPMFNQENSGKITLKDLASLYYKSQGQGVIGDNPTPYHAANVYADEFGGPPGSLFDLVGSPVKRPEEVRKMLRARIDAAGGDRQAVFDQLVGQVNQRLDKQTAEETGLKPSQVAELKGAKDTSVGGGEANGMTSTMMNDWFNQYVTPYVDYQTTLLNYQADMFDQIASQVMSTATGPKAELFQMYAPLISAAYHQKAATFGANFLNGNDNGSLIMQLLKGGKRNASILNFLNTQSQPIDTGAGTFDPTVLAALGQTG